MKEISPKILSILVDGESVSDLPATVCTYPHFHSTLIIWFQKVYLTTDRSKAATTF